MKQDRSVQGSCAIKHTIVVQGRALQSAQQARVIGLVGGGNSGSSRGGGCVVVAVVAHGLRCFSSSRCGGGVPLLLLFSASFLIHSMWRRMTAAAASTVQVLQESRAETRKAALFLLTPVRCVFFAHGSCSSSSSCKESKVALYVVCIKGTTKGLVGCCCEFCSSARSVSFLCHPPQTNGH